MSGNEHRILLIDNYDSFTYNLVQAFQVENAEVLVYRNDEIDVQSISEINPTHIVISPGPGNPKNAGISIKVIESFYQTIPILGVCLGHQCLVEFFGGKIIRAEKLMHGKPLKLSMTIRQFLEICLSHSQQEDIILYLQTKTPCQANFSYQPKQKRER